MIDEKKLLSDLEKWMNDTSYLKEKYSVDNIMYAHAEIAHDVISTIIEKINEQEKVVPKLWFPTIAELAKEVAEKAMDEYEYNGKTFRQWIDEIQKRKWIPVSDHLPEDVDNRFFMCVVENHEEDPPMYCQYSEEYGFGFWHHIFNQHTLGFVDSYFMTNEELGYEKVIAWMELPDSYRKDSNV